MALSAASIRRSFRPRRHIKVHDAARQLWDWMKGSHHKTAQFVGKLKEFASESETEDIRCAASMISWQGQDGPESLAATVCTGPGVAFHQVLAEDRPPGSSDVSLCPKHSAAYHQTRYHMKCAVVGCNHEGTMLHSSVRWCAQHGPEGGTTSTSRRRSRSRSRARSRAEATEEGESEEEQGRGASASLHQAIHRNLRSSAIWRG